MTDYLCCVSAAADNEGTSVQVYIDDPGLEEILRLPMAVDAATVAGLAGSLIGQASITDSGMSEDLASCLGAFHCVNVHMKGNRSFSFVLYGLEGGGYGIFIHPESSPICFWHDISDSLLQAEPGGAYGEDQISMVTFAINLLFYLNTYPDMLSPVPPETGRKEPEAKMLGASESIKKTFREISEAGNSGPSYLYYRRGCWVHYTAERYRKARYTTGPRRASFCRRKEGESAGTLKPASS